MLNRIIIGMVLLLLKSTIKICNGNSKNAIRMSSSSSSVTFYYNDVYKQPLPLGHRYFHNNNNNNNNNILLSI